jgi:hypothetical protein
MTDDKNKKFFKTIVVKFQFDANSFALDKVTPEYVLRILKQKGLENYGVVLEAEEEDDD